MLTFFDLEGHQEALLLRIVFRQRGNDLHVRKTVLEIVAANQIAVGLDAVRVVDVIAAEKTQQIRFARLDHVAKAKGRIGLVADEFDRIDAGLVAFGNLEDQVDPIVRLLDDLWNHLHVVAAGVAINFRDSLRVGLNHRTRQRAARLGLNFRTELFVLDLLVALESHAADHRVFDHGHNKLATSLADFHILEQTGFDQSLEAVVYMSLVQRPAKPWLEVGTDGSRLDTAVSLHLNRIHRLRGRRRTQKPSRCSERHRKHDQGGKQAPPYPHSNIHAQHVLVIRNGRYGADVAKSPSKRFPIALKCCSLVIKTSTTTALCVWCSRSQPVH